MEKSITMVMSQDHETEIDAVGVRMRSTVDRVDRIRGITYIYALIHPQTNEIRYIGRSIDPKGRYSSHLHSRSKTYCARWVRRMVRLGLPPICQVIDLTADRDAADLETWWIAKLRTAGYRLTNLTDGGDGVAHPSPEVLAKKRATRARNWALLTVEEQESRLERMREDARRRLHTPAARAKVRATRLGQPASISLEAIQRRAATLRETNQRDATKARRSEATTRRWKEREGEQEKRWSTVSDACLDCDRHTVRHGAFGLCITCWKRHRRAGTLDQYANANRITARWSKRFSACLGCGSTERKHYGRGYCVYCYPRAFPRLRSDGHRVKKEPRPTFRQSTEEA